MLYPGQKLVDRLEYFFLLPDKWQMIDAWKAFTFLRTSGLLSEDPVGLKAELLAELRDCQPATSWPVEPPSRTMAQLLKTCEQLRRKQEEEKKKQAAAKAKREADKAEKMRQARMVEMKSDPESWIKKATSLVEARCTENYRDAASILADLREAFSGEDGDKIARKHAAHLMKKHPTLHVLKSSLRKCGLLDEPSNQKVTDSAESRPFQEDQFLSNFGFSRKLRCICARASNPAGLPFGSDTGSVGIA